ncbi:MAG: hypothetical protein K0R57_462 [Paenibacillaceae bacterium]|jgi:hypothetical protein|nr:hypothetical protein [Paenibacillaceae bacterium]
MSFTRTTNKPMIYVIYAIIGLVLSLAQIIHHFTYWGYISLLLVILAVMAGMHAYGVKGHLQWSSFLLAVGSGVYGYWQQQSGESSWLVKLAGVGYDTARLFALEGDFASGSPFQLPLEIARWSAVVTLASTVLALIYRFTKTSIKHQMLYLIGGHYVLIGASEAVYLLAHDLLKKGKRVVCAGQSPDLTVRLKELGAVALDEDAKENRLLHKLLLHKTRACLLLDDRDDVNLNWLIRIKEALESGELRSGKSKPISLIVHLRDRKFADIFEGFQEELLESQQLDVKTVSISNLLAKLMFVRHPLYEHPYLDLRNQDEQPLHLVIAGFSDMGKEILLQALLLAHYPNEQKPLVTLIDHQIASQVAAFRKRCPNLDQVCELHTLEANPAAGISLSGITAKPTHVFVCLEDDAADITNGLFAGEECADVPIFIQVNRSVSLARWLQKHKSRFHHFHHIGDLHEVATEEYMINEELDQFAKLIHYNYLDEARKADLSVDEAWNAGSMNILTKESNRAQADAVDTKLYLLGLKRVKKNELNGREAIAPEQYAHLVKGELVKLARVEHNRWNAFHYLHGWTAKTSHADGKSKNPNLKQHACLVSYYELDEIGRIYGKDFKQYDLDTIEKLHMELDRLGYALIQRNDVHSIETPERSNKKSRT